MLLIMREKYAKVEIKYDILLFFAGLICMSH